MSSISSDQKYPILRLPVGYARYDCELNPLVSICLKQMKGGWSVVVEKNKQAVVCTYCFKLQDAVRLWVAAVRMRDLPPGEITEWSLAHISGDYNSIIWWDPDKEANSNKSK